jgi:hypothetical protein
MSQDSQSGVLFPGNISFGQGSLFTAALHVRTHRSAAPALLVVGERIRFPIAVWGTPGKAASGQTADLFQVQDSTGTHRGGIRPDLTPYGCLERIRVTPITIADDYSEGGRIRGLSSVPGPIQVGLAPKEASPWYMGAALTVVGGPEDSIGVLARNRTCVTTPLVLQAAVSQTASVLEIRDREGLLRGGIHIETGVFGCLEEIAVVTSSWRRWIDPPPDDRGDEIPLSRAVMYVTAEY